MVYIHRCEELIARVRGEIARRGEFYPVWAYYKPVKIHFEFIVDYIFGEVPDKMKVGFLEEMTLAELLTRLEEQNGSVTEI